MKYQILYSLAQLRCPKKKFPENPQPGKLQPQRPISGNHSIWNNLEEGAANYVFQLLFLLEFGAVDRLCRGVPLPPTLTRMEVAARSVAAAGLERPPAHQTLARRPCECAGHVAGRRALP